MSLYLALIESGAHAACYLTYVYDEQQGINSDSSCSSLSSKVALLCKYLTAYLNVLEFARGTDEVHVLDLMCGEGKYADGAEGSPVTIARIVKNHHYSRSPSNRIEIWFNDYGQSEVEPDKTKIERVRETCDPILRSLPEDQYKVQISDRDALDVGKEAASIIGRRQKTKGLFFLVTACYSRAERLA